MAAERIGAPLLAHAERATTTTTTTTTTTAATAAAAAATTTIHALLSCTACLSCLHVHAFV